MSETFTVTIEGVSGQSHCRADERVLVALERAQGLGRLKGLPRRLPVGCRRGGCGICRARVLSGEYEHSPMSRTHISAADEADGIILACSIYPLSDLTLRLETPLPPKQLAGLAARAHAPQAQSSQR